MTVDTTPAIGYADPMAKKTAEPTKYYREDFAAALGIRPDSLPRPSSAGSFPPPDGRDAFGHHLCPYWYESTVQAYIARRPGKAWKAGLVKGEDGTFVRPADPAPPVPSRTRRRPAAPGAAPPRTRTSVKR